MISETTAMRIQELKSQGRTQVWIARELQVSRSTIARVLHGDWKPRRFRPRQVVRLLELWDTAMSYDRGSEVGRCRASREPIYLPCVSCLAGVLERFGVRTPSRWHRGECECGGNFTGVRPPPRSATVWQRPR